MGPKQKYLDRFGVPVDKYSNESHIFPSTGLLSLVPRMIKVEEQKVKVLEKSKDKLSIFKFSDWSKIIEINKQIDAIENYIDDLNDYKEAWDEYSKEKKEYYENGGLNTTS